MPLHFNTLLAEAKIAPARVRLLRHQDHRADTGRTPYRLWLHDRPMFEAYQKSQSPKNQSRLLGDYWASFVVTPARETMFVGLYRCRYLGVNEFEHSRPHAAGVDLPGTCDLYDLTIDKRLHDLAGRLIINWGDAQRVWVQRADKQDKFVLQIKETFSEERFVGFNGFISPLSEIDRLPNTWNASLSSVRGVYLLTCPKTREQYVGSATGDDGFLGRWLDYVRNGHGGNIMLRSREPSDYQVSILEVAGSTATPEDIVAMEQRWKKKLQTQLMGLNGN